MSNPALLNLLAAVAAQKTSTATLGSLTKMHPLDLQIAVQVAQDEGLVVMTEKMHPPLAFTADAMPWVDKYFPHIKALFQ